MLVTAQISITIVPTNTVHQASFIYYNHSFVFLTKAAHLNIFRNAIALLKLTFQLFYNQKYTFCIQICRLPV